MAFGAGNEQWRVEVFVAGIHVRTLPHQNLYHSHVPLSGFTLRV